MEKKDLQIISLFEAPVVTVLVTDSYTNDVLYQGDSMREANLVYVSWFKQGGRAVSVYRKTRLFTEREAMQLQAQGLKANFAKLQPFLDKLPQRIANIYISTITGTPVSQETYEIAKTFHPEYFKTIVTQQNISYGSHKAKQEKNNRPVPGKTRS